MRIRCPRQRILGAAESWGTWVCHTGGEIVCLGLPQTRLSGFLRFPSPSGRRPIAGLPVKLFANGEVVWEADIGNRPRNITFRVRRKTAGVSGWWRLRIRAKADLSAEQRDATLAIDRRVPTVGFERLVIVPENDLKTRIDILLFSFLTQQTPLEFTANGNTMHVYKHSAKVILQLNRAKFQQ